MSQPPAIKLERRARMLLRAYPADYRRDRADEVIGTLLEATPDGRSVPSARDARALIAGGVRARAARNRRLSTTTNLRLALLLGLSIFLSFNVNWVLATWEVGYDRFSWLAITAGLLSVAVALAPWLGRRTVTTAIAAPAAAVLAFQVHSESHWIPFQERPEFEAWLAVLLIAMVALAALSGGPARLPRSWLCLPSVPLAGIAVGDLLRLWARPNGSEAAYLHEFLLTTMDIPEYAILLLAAVVACWVVTDVRPAFALVAAALLTSLLWDLQNLALNPFGRVSTEEAALLVVLPTAIGLPVVLALAWLLRRQAAARLGPLPRP
jgi:hypothetical protein